MLVLIATVLSAFADEPCRWRLTGNYSVEWVEQGQPQGARIVLREPRWKLHGLGWHATGTAVCEGCADGKDFGAILWLDIGDPAKRSIDKMIGADAAAGALAMSPFGVLGDYRVKSAPVPVSIGSLRGRAQPLTIRRKEGIANEIISFAVAEGCLSLYAILYEDKGSAISIDRLAPFVAGIAVERYTPAFVPPVQRPAVPQEDFLLGDARRRAEEEGR